jgi:hypothetical protein
MAEFGIPRQYHRSFVRSPKPSMFIAIDLGTVLRYDMREIPREKVYVNMLDDYFVPTIYFSLLKDEYQPRLRCDALKFFMLSISRQLTFRLSGMGSWAIVSVASPVGLHDRAG